MARTKPPTGPRYPGAPTRDRAAAARKAACMVPPCGTQELLVLWTAARMPITAASTASEVPSETEA
eukprot:3259566-Prymnesium_polylepis.1